MEGTALGLGHFWSQADALIRFTAWLLLAMSVGSWFLILWKTLAWWRVRRAARGLDAFWQARSIDEAIAQLKPIDPELIFVPLAASGAATASWQWLSSTCHLARSTSRSPMHASRPGCS